MSNGLHNGLYNGLFPGLQNGLFENEHYLDAIDYDLLNIYDATKIVDATQKRASKFLVYNYKKYGLWNRTIALYPMIGGTANAHKFNWKDPRDLDVAYRLVYGGSLLHSATGMKGNAAGFADTKLAPSAALRLNDAHLSFYAGTEGGLSSFEMGAGGSGGPYTMLQLKYINGLFYGDINQTAEDGILNPYKYGLFTASRTASNDKKLYGQGEVLFNGTLASTSLTSRTIYILADNNNGTTSFYSSRECRFASIGYGLTPAQAFMQFQIVQGYQTILGRNVY
jgi:hypothetical protein